MSRIQVVADTALVPIHADLVGFFHGGPLDQAWIFNSPTDQWIALTEDHPDINVAGFNWFDHPLDGSKVLRICVIPPLQMTPLSEPISPTIEGEIHTYHLHNFRSSFGDVAVYRLAGTERPTTLPSSFARAARARPRRESFYDPVLGNFPGDSPQVRHSDLVSSAAYWRDFLERHSDVRPDIGSSTACFECGATVKTEHVWLKKSDPNVALCEGCFRTAETAGRAKEGPHAN